MASVHHLRHIFVRLRRFLHDQLRRSDTDGDTLRGQLVQYLLILQCAATRVATLCAARSVTRRTKRLIHACLCSSKDVGTGAHGAANQHGLSDKLIVHRDQRMVGRKCPGTALAMHQQSLHFSIHHVLLHLRNIMRHIINHMHVEIIRFSVELLREGLAHEEGHAGAVHPGIVGGRGHAGEVILSFRRVDARTGQLSVVGH
mmetsp:Transcript_44211/g.77086  ORF Transcript_44211/g.77086 Transcript_44211/m.77086 type:complete len:201 (-) Transcript_44211:938-1540(-)